MLAAALAIALTWFGGVIDRAAVATAQAQPTADEGRFDLEIEAIQGLLEIQQIPAWLLYDSDGLNPIARSVAQPVGDRTLHRWFYLVPAEGEPVLLVHRADASRFAHLPGRSVEYTNYESFGQGLVSLLDGIEEVAMEYSPKAALPALSRVDAGTIELVRAQGVDVRSSADLVPFSLSLWRPEQRVSHHVAAHHLGKLRAAALAFVAERVRDQVAVTEQDVQDFLQRGYEVRGLVGPLPVVAAGVNTSDPAYVPTLERSSEIQRGDLLLIEMAARVAAQPRSVYATTSAMAYVGETVPARYERPFQALVQARDAAVELIRDRVERRRVIKGFEVDREVRTVLERGGYGDAFLLHRAGHSIDTSRYGGGANLDDYDTHDTRALLMGAGVAVAPGLYEAGEFGMRTAVNVHIRPLGIEVSSPGQTEITAVLAP
ncbi:MAG: M24 family metallopeptidase [Haliangiales bacterium]